MQIRKAITVSALVSLLIMPGASLLDAQGKMQERLNTSATVLQELIDASDAGIPEGLLEDAECVGVIPGVKKATFGFGGRYGRGVGRVQDEQRNWPLGIAIDAGARRREFRFSVGWFFNGCCDVVHDTEQHGKLAEG